MIVQSHVALQPSSRIAFSREVLGGYGCSFERSGALSMVRRSVQMWVVSFQCIAS